MDKETLAKETELARQEGDHDRIRELGRMERMNNLDEAEPQYAETDSPESDGQSALQNRAERAASMAQAVGNDNLADSLQTVASADEPERVLRQEIAVAQDRSPENVDALRELAEGDE
jgi:hypothetical protein